MSQASALLSSGGVTRTFTATTPDDFPKPGYSTSPPTAANDSSQGYSSGSLWTSTATGEVWVCQSAAVGAARWIILSPAIVQAINAGYYNLPFGHGVPITGAAGAANTIYLLFALILKRVTISALGAAITTTAAGGSFQLGIYNHNLATSRASTLALSTIIGSTVTGGKINLAAAQNAQIGPGGFWLAKNADNVATFLGQGVAYPPAQSLIGGTNASTAMPAGTSNGSQFAGFSVSSPFGSMPADLSGSTFTNVIPGAVPMMDFLAASVP